MKLLIEEIRLPETRISELERKLARCAKLSPACQTLLSIPGIGLLTATAMVAATRGNVAHFRAGAPLRLLLRAHPKEHSSGNTRHLGRISKRGESLAHAHHPRCARRPARRRRGHPGR
ncbi:MAG: transposase [Chromatiales bacterium]